VMFERKIGQLDLRLGAASQIVCDRHVAVGLRAADDVRVERVDLAGNSDRSDRVRSRRFLFGRVVLIDLVALSFADGLKCSDRFPDRFGQRDIDGERIARDGHALNGRRGFGVRFGLDAVDEFESAFTRTAGERDHAALRAFLEVFGVARYLDIDGRPRRAVLIDRHFGVFRDGRTAADIAGRCFIAVALVERFRIGDRAAPAAVARFGIRFRLLDLRLLLAGSLFRRCRSKKIKLIEMRLIF
jgi:hypothetical protein